MRRTTLLTLVVAVTLCLASGVALAAATVVNGSAINSVSVVREDQVQILLGPGKPFPSTTFADLPGASTTINVPAGERGLLLARFSAESDCESEGPGYCSLRIVATPTGGQATEMQPAAGLDFAFDSPDAGEIGLLHNDTLDALSMDRSLVVGPGNYNVKVQWAPASTNVHWFTLDDWSLTVEKARVP
jgi:hypothetical protein